MRDSARGTGEQPCWDDRLLHEYAGLRQRLEGKVACLEVDLQLPWIDAIQRLKQRHGVRILAHTYQSAEIFHGVADFTGDSLALAEHAAGCDAEILLVCGVHFMAESAKLLAPDKTVLLPSLDAGCSLADSISAEDVRTLRAKYPGVPVVSYVNTSAEVKAESDACCTSANARRVVEAMGSERVIFLPDGYLGAHVAEQTDVELLMWPGRCEVHEKFTRRQAKEARRSASTAVLAHPECAPDVLQEADFVGSTSAMQHWIQREQPAEVALISECSMADNLRVLFPQIQFLPPCGLCPHMQKITLQNIYFSLRDSVYPIEIEINVAQNARAALQRMLDIGRDPSA